VRAASAAPPERAGFAAAWCRVSLATKRGLRVPLSADIADFTRHDMTFDGRTKPVLVTGAGPAVIVMHEIFGFTPTLARLCRWFRDAGFCVYAPILFGTPDATNPEAITLARTAWICISREFAVLAANRSRRARGADHAGHGRYHGNQDGAEKRHQLLTTTGAEECVLGGNGTLTCRPQSL
jgi:hypothetical protein